MKTLGLRKNPPDEFSEGTRGGDNKGNETNPDTVQGTPEDEEDATRGKESNFVQQYQSCGEGR